MRTDQDKSQGNANVKSMLQQATVKFIILRDLCNNLTKLSKDLWESKSWPETALGREQGYNNQLKPY